jgi:glycosyltransferase involved in cell wall biosynthesis
MAASLQRHKRRGLSAAVRDDVAALSAAALAEPSMEARTPRQSHELGKPVETASDGPGGDRAVARPNGEGVPEPALVRGAPSHVEPNPGGQNGPRVQNGKAAEGKPSNGSAEPADPEAAADDPAEPAPSDRAADDPLPKFRAHLDEVSDTEISGWIMQPDQPSQRCVVALKEGEQILARTVATRFRDDLVSAGIGDGCYAFVLSIPISLFDGREHMLEIVEEGTGFALAAEPVRWRFANPENHTAFSSAAERMGVTRLFGASHQSALQMLEQSPTEFRDNGVDQAEALDIVGVSPQTKTGAYPHSAPVVGTRILFDISDLAYYIGEHANLTGIQRVQSSIVLAVLRHHLVPQTNLVFLSFNAKTRSWMTIPTGFLFSLLEDLLLPESRRLVTFPREEARYGLLPGAREFDGIGVLDDGNDSVLCLLGAAWVHQDYIQRVLALKRQFGTRFVMTVHDLIPVYARETCDQDTARVFEEFMRRALRHVDHVLSVSENTAKDIARYTETLQIPTPPITVTKNGSSFAEFLPNATTAGQLRASDIPERFVLFVATIEGRKNHQLMLDIWRRMIAEGDDPPHLICVGRLGWKSSSFISTLVETNYLDGKVMLLRDISDTDLKLLYSGCLFTVCPTLYEGWGLPVGESLALGKICVSSDRASIPEVAGDCGVYIDIDNFEQSLGVVRDLVSDTAARRKLEAKIRRAYKPVTWHSVAEGVVNACRAAPKVKWQEPYPYTIVPYSSEISFARLDRNIDGTGELLLTRIAGQRKGLYLGNPLDGQAFVRGEEARSSGSWAYPEEWGTWACNGGGEIALGLGPNDSQLYYVFLRLRASGPVISEPIRLLANGDKVWEGPLGPQPKDVVFRVHRKVTNAGGWRLRINAQIKLTPELRNQIATVDSRMPTIGFERLIVVPDNDLKTRLDILYTLLL